MKKTTRLIIRAATVFILMGGINVACTKDKKPPSAPPETKKEEPAPTPTALQLSVSESSGAVSISITGAPADGTLECSLDGARIDQCTTGMNIPNLSPGDHRLSVISKKEGQILATGEVGFVVKTPAPTGIDMSTVSPLSLVIDDAEFANGQAVKIDQPFTVKFRFVTEHKCAAPPTVECSYDSFPPKSWSKCTTPTTFLVAKGRMAKGLQHLSVRGVCDKDIGPNLHVNWHGVPADYQPLMIEGLKDTKGRHIFRLVKANDCTETELLFQCAKPGSEEFAKCANIHRSVQNGFRIRAHCGDKQGPALSIVK